jgi:hypothetical protein
MQKKIADCQRSELFRFAKNGLGLDVPYAEATKESLIAALREAGYTSETIDVPDQSGDPAAAPSVRPGVVETGDPDVTATMVDPWRVQVRIRIPSRDEPGGADTVPVCVNGRNAEIQRDTEVDLPAPYVRVLMDAQTRVFDFDENGQPIHPGRLVRSYPFDLVHVPAEVRDYLGFSGR